MMSLQGHCVLSVMYVLEVAEFIGAEGLVLGQQQSQSRKPRGVILADKTALEKETFVVNYGQYIYNCGSQSFYATLH